jgi:hypothetical protein
MYSLNVWLQSALHADTERKIWALNHHSCTAAPATSLGTFSYDHHYTSPIQFRRSGTCSDPLNAEINPICHLLALLAAHHILNVSRIQHCDGSEVDIFVSYSSVTGTAWSEMNVNLFFVMDHWLKRSSLSKQHSATKVHTGVTDDVRGSNRFTSPSSIDQF